MLWTTTARRESTEWNNLRLSPIAGNGSVSVFRMNEEKRVKLLRTLFCSPCYWILLRMKAHDSSFFTDHPSVHSPKKSPMRYQPNHKDILYHLSCENREIGNHNYFVEILGNRQYKKAILLIEICGRCSTDGRTENTSSIYKRVVSLGWKLSFKIKN